MKKIFNIAFTLVLASLAIVSCKKESLEYDGPVLAHFVNQSGSYYVDEDVETFSIPIGLTKPSDSDITLTITVSEESTGVEGENFTLESNQITIKAGEVLSDLVVLGNFESLNEAKTVVFEIESSDKTALYNNTYTMVIQQFCPFVRDEMLGIYLFESDFWLEGDDPYEVEVIADPEDENAIIILDLYAPGIDIKVILDASNKANFVTSVPRQKAWVSGTYGDASLKGGTGNFSACDKTFSYSSEHVVSAGSFGVDDAFFTKVD